MSEARYWELELELANKALSLGFESREEMFQNAQDLDTRERQSIACIILAQSKILKTMIKSKPKQTILRLVK